MNRPFRILIAGSLAALLCAILGALWLVWHSLQESRQLERQNRELQASLEASRIRVENFCEYPVDALCKMDARTGSVAAVMAGSAPSATPQSASALDADPSLAIKHQKAVAAVQSLLAAADLKAKPAPAAPVDEKVKADDTALPAPKARPAKQDSKKAERPSPTKESDTRPETKDKAAPQPAVLPQEKKVDIPPAPVKEQNTTAVAPKTPSTPPAAPAPSVAPTAAKAEPPITAQKSEAPAAPAPASGDAAPAPATPSVPEPSEARDPRPSISGKLVFLPEEKNESGTPAPQKASEQKAKKTNAAPAPKAAQKATPTAASAPKAPQQKPAAKPAPVQEKPSAQSTSGKDVRKSWSSVEHDGTNFGFTITGAGDSLPASAQLVAKPWRYELTLKGNWAVQPHANVENRLVKSMSVSKEGDSTVITFHLKQKPYRCSLHRPDKRTATVRIR